MFKKCSNDQWRHKYFDKTSLANIKQFTVYPSYHYISTKDLSVKYQVFFFKTNIKVFHYFSTKQLNSIRIQAHLRRKISCRVYSTPGVQSEAQVDRTKSESDEEGGKVGRDLHVLVVRHGQDDDHEQRGAQHLVRKHV